MSLLMVLVAGGSVVLYQVQNHVSICGRTNFPFQQHLAPAHIANVGRFADLVISVFDWLNSPPDLSRQR